MNNKGRVIQLIFWFRIRCFVIDSCEEEEEEAGLKIEIYKKKKKANEFSFIYNTASLNNKDLINCILL